MRFRTVLLTSMAGTTIVAGFVFSVAGRAPASAADQIAPDFEISSRAAAESVRRLTTGAPPEQASAFEDGRVTQAEYRGAVNRALDCVVASVSQAADDRGVEIEVRPGRPELSADGFQYTFTFEIRLPPDAGDLPADAQAQLSQMQGDCQDRFMNRVEVAYQVGSLASPTFTEDVAARFTGCLHRSGYEIDESRSSAGARVSLASVLEDIATSDNIEAVECVEAAPAITADPIGSVNFLLTGSPTG